MMTDLPLKSPPTQPIQLLERTVHGWPVRAYIQAFCVTLGCMLGLTAPWFTVPHSSWLRSWDLVLDVTLTLVFLTWWFLSAKFLHRLYGNPWHHD